MLCLWQGVVQMDEPEGPRDVLDRTSVPQERTILMLIAIPDDLVRKAKKRLFGGPS